MHDVVKIKFINSKVGYALANSLNGNSFTPGMLKTTDGGQTWQTFNLNNYVGGGRFYDHTTFIVPADNVVYIYMLDTSPKLIKSTNGGQTWVTTALPYQINHLQFVNTLVAYASTYISGSISLVKTTNGGITWNPVALPFNDGITSLYFSSVDVGYVVAVKRIYKTSNGGLTWQGAEIDLNSNVGINQTKIVFTDPNLGYLLVK